MGIFNKTSCSKSGQAEAGAALIEFVLVFPVLLLLTLGAIDLGLLIKDQMALNHVAREAVRSAAVGTDAETVKMRLRGWAKDLGLVNGEVGAEIQGGRLPGDQALAFLTYDHKFILARFLGLPDKVTIQSKMVMRRE